MRFNYYILFIILGLSILTINTDSQNGPGVGPYTSSVKEIKSDTQMQNLDAQKSIYCESRGRSIAHGWIEDVIIGQYEFTSGSNSGYANLTNKEFDIKCGAFNSFDIRSGQPHTATRHNWRVWIDYDQNGNFENDEQVIYNHSVNMKGLVYIPTLSKLTYRTGMRIAMNKDEIPNACGTFENGEVEDYTVVLNINNFQGTSTQTDNVLSKGLSDKEIKIYPNPSRVDDPIYIEYTAANEENVNITVFSIDGRLVESVTYPSTPGKNKINIEGALVENGVYLIKMQIASFNFIKKITIVD